MQQIIPIPAFSDNYIWLITDDAQTRGVVVDPGSDRPVHDTLEQRGITLCGILITHHHMDHTGGITGLNAGHPVPVYGPSSDNIPGLSHPLKHNDKVILEEIDTSFTIIGTPGHTSGDITYYTQIENRPVIFTGDALFIAGCGRVFEGTPGQMLESLDRLKAFPADTLVYCGHEYTEQNLRFAIAVEPDNRDIAESRENIARLRSEGTPSVPGSLKDELLTNPFLRCNKASVKKMAEEQAGHALKTEADVFRVIREWKNKF